MTSADLGHEAISKIAEGDPVEAAAFRPPKQRQPPHTLHVTQVPEAKVLLSGIRINLIMAITERMAKDPNPKVLTILN